MPCPACGEAGKGDPGANFRPVWSKQCEDRSASLRFPALWPNRGQSGEHPINKMTLSLPHLSCVFQSSLIGLLALCGVVGQAATANVLAGKQVTLSLTVQGTAPFTYKWLKNGVVLTGATASSYVISSFQAASAGAYTAKVTNSAGSTTSDSAILSLAVLPVITQQPLSQTVVSGGAVSFKVTATGNPAPTYQWWKNGTALTGATGSTYAIASVATASAGTYSVVVKNSAGTVTSAGAVLTVNTAPVITKQPAGKTVITGSSMTFAVTATGTPAPTYQWRKNGTALTGATGSSYTIAAVTTGSAGTYSVVVKNVVGSVTSSNATLAVNPPLPKPSDYNADGKSDILWQNLLTGDHQLWLMAGTAVASKVTLSRMTTDWEVVGASDFNTDGGNDILWQNLVTRESALWLMAGPTLVGGVSLGVAPTGMLMAGTGDFNADGMPDIVWQNVSTGACSIRLMNGTLPGTSIGIGTAPAGWSVAGTGDFNGDGKPDLLWENNADGRYARVWLMNGTAFVSSNDLAPQTTGWGVGGTGDFNGDGKTDVLWQHASTGARKIALMSGLVKASEVSLGVMPPEWIMVN